MAEANPEPQIPDDNKAELAKQIEMAKANPEPQIPVDDAEIAVIVQELSIKDSETVKDNTLIEVMIFAKELVAFILRKLKHDWVDEMKSRPQLKSMLKQRFSHVIGKAVLDIMSYHKTEMADAYTNLESRKIVERAQFYEQLYKTAECYLKSGYDPERFLYMAASFIGVAEIFVGKGNRHMADASALVLAYFLNRFILKEEFNTTKDWDSLLNTAEDISKNYGNEVKPKFVLPTLDEKFSSVL